MGTEGLLGHYRHSSLHWSLLLKILRRFPHLTCSFVEGRSEELHQFEINRDKILGPVTKLFGSKPPGLVGVLRFLK